MCLKTFIAAPFQEEKTKTIAICGGKENAAPKVAPNDNVISKAQCLQRERERDGECIQPRRPTFFPSLTPSRRRRACLEHGMMARNSNQLASTSIEIPAPKRAMHVDSMLCHHEPQAQQHEILTIEESVAMPSIIEESDFEMCHPSIPPRNLEEEFLAVATPPRNIDKELLAMPGTSLAPIHRLPPRNQSIADELEEDESTNIGVDPQANRYLNRHYLGRMDVSCFHCKALHWMGEKLANSSLIHPFFGTCCLQGKIKLPSLIAPSLALQELYDGNDERSKSFRHHTREYNATNAFTSLGAKLDTRVLNGRGPLSFTIHGELRHRTGSLLPQPGHEAIYSQLYIYDPESALNARNNRNPHLRRDVFKTIQDCLLTFNPFPEKFLRAFEILNQSESVGQNLPAFLHYSSSTDRRRYNLPTADEIAIILPGDGTEKSGMRDIVLHLRGNNGLMQVNECHPVYLPLHYVLLFPRGELGWEPEMRHWDVRSKQYTNKRLTQMEFYSFRLFQRNSEYSTILRAGKLFQEFIVDAWAATEQNRLNFHRLNQGKIRSELYQDLANIGPDGLGPGQVEKRWKPRERGFAIGRMYFVSPNAGEIFYLRLLLSVVRGPESYECLRTVNNILHDTFKSTCIARGLLEDDEEWVQCLEEAAIMKTGYQLRRLFCVILTQCSPSQPAALWDKFAMHICDDLACKIQVLFFIPNPTAAQIEDYGLYLLDELLQESGKNLKDFAPMPLPIGNWSVVVGNRFILEHQQLISDAQRSDMNINVESLNEEQRAVYTAITTSVFENKGRTFFLNRGAGTGKTFLYNTVATKCRSLGHVVVSVASSGIASLLLVGGRTAHSTFSIPLDVLEDSFCSFSKQSLQAEMFRKTRLIIWDEVPMQHRYCVEAVDRTLQDICDNNKPFGGITVVLGGDFRQILPVIPKGVREQIVGASLRRSVLWNGMHILTLSLNMRLNSTDLANSNFAEFLNEIGTNSEEVVELPSTIQKCESVSELLFTMYPQLDVVGTITPTFLNERTILSARNDDVSAINLAALNVFPEDTTTYFAADKMSFDDAHDHTITNRYPNEYLNSLNPSGLPPFKLDLKVGCPIMLLRNIAPKAGLCNGTRLMIVNCANRIIEAQILTGDKFGDLVFIPRISLTPSSSEMPFEMTRRQFPIRLAYAMTINKSQGQSVNFVGIDLRTPVFSHGQLYVALSRCTSGDRTSVLLSNDASRSTTNIVYPEVLLQ
ncbi:hypothetical protein RHMOL_Rhmol09G0230200 [Rhododendron molle]|uniref:Uncharacterized protein n=1 Tax=Rhododendron molle TaxID=49168 RepID=A0ACC0MGC8_RHOML|nr:hypothetical protein RHMOL_Rhmol09G0230200 [Rhododendron molle]